MKTKLLILLFLPLFGYSQWWGEGIKTTENITVTTDAWGDIRFKPDGTEFYCVDNSSDSIVQYSLTTAWDLSTASRTGAEYIGGLIVDPTGIYIKSDGASIYIVASPTVGNENVYWYYMLTPWDITTATYNSDEFFNVGAQDSNPVSVFLKSDGTKMYISGTENDSVYEYALDPAWEISTANYSNATSISQTPRSIYLFADRMYVTTSSDEIFEYSMTTDWTISTAIFRQSWYTGNEDGITMGIDFRPDKSYVYVLGFLTTTVYEYLW